MTEPARVGMIPRQHKDLEASVAESLGGIVKKYLNYDGAPSWLSTWVGMKPQPFNMHRGFLFMDYNVHHSACVEAKVASTVGLGFYRAPVEEDVEVPGAPGPDGTPGPASKMKQVRTDPLSGRPELEPRSEVSRVLDPLCETTFQETITKVVMDYWVTGNGYLEVTRRNGEIAGLHHIPAAWVFVVVDDEFGARHYEAIGDDLGMSGSRTFAAYGKRDDLIARAASNMGYIPGPAGDIFLSPARPRGRPRKDTFRRQDVLSELIHFRKPSARDRFYGYPDWLSATVRVELSQCLHQHTYDFFLNRGVPEYLLAVLGEDVNTKDWNALNESLKGHIGLGNSHKSATLNLRGANTRVELFKLALEGKTDGLYSELETALSTGVVSAHGVPPLLAGIQIPGKMGAANELPNALTAFQVLKIGPAQEQIQTILLNTIGPELGLDEKELRLRTILEEINTDRADTVARMRQPLAEAQAEGRSPDDGLILE